MTIPTSPIAVKKIWHRDQWRIALQFAYDTELIEKIKSIEGRRYSGSRKCWHIPYTRSAFDALEALGIPLEIETTTSSQDLHDSQPIGAAGISSSPKLPTDIAPPTRHASDAPAAEEMAGTDISDAAASEIHVRYSSGQFVLHTPYKADVIRRIKSLQGVWWNHGQKAWIIKGSAVNHKRLQQWFSCWEDDQYGRIRDTILRTASPQSLSLYPLPDTQDEIAVELRGYEISLRAIKQVPGRRYESGYKRWRIPNHAECIARLIQCYLDQGVQVDNRLTDTSKHRVQATTPRQRQAYLLSKYSDDRLRELAESMSDSMISLGYSWSTIKSYTAEIVKFSSWLIAKKRDAATLSDVQAYLADLAKGGISESRHQLVVSALKYYYTRVNNRPDVLPTEIERPRKSFRIPRILSQKEVSRLIDAVDNVKHKTVLYTLYSSGLRLGELLALRLEDIKWDRDQIYVRSGKGRKDRVVPLAHHLKAVLHSYCARYKPSDYLLEGRKPGSRYSAGSVQKVVKKAARAAGITQKVTPHTLRHCYATHLHDEGISIRYVQELLGHKNIKTTLIYTHVSTSTLSSIKSPLDRLKG